MNDIVQGDIDSPMVSFEQPNDVNTALTSLETPDVVCLDGLDSITPTIGLETDGLPVPQNEIEALKMMAAVGNPTDVCPCGLTTKAECLDILDSLTLKTEPQDSRFPVKQEFKEEEEKSEEEALMPKQEWWVVLMKTFEISLIYLYIEILVFVSRSRDKSQNKK